MLAEARRLEARAHDQLEWGKWSSSRASNDAMALRRAARGPFARRLAPLMDRAFGWAAKAKDNNASAAIGPFIRLFDARFGLDDVRAAELTMEIEGVDGFRLTGHSSMREISRDPADLVTQTCGRHHQYPDGFMLYLGTMFAPVEDRDATGAGFTHHREDRVSISPQGLGTLTNIVRLSTEVPEWTLGTAALMRNLAGRGLL